MPKRSTPPIERIAEAVATIRKIKPASLFSPVRESEKVASARTFAMGACIAAGIPLGCIAHKFGRNWRTVYNAEKSCERRRKNSQRFAEEWENALAMAQAQSEPAGIAEA